MKKVIETGSDIYNHIVVPNEAKSWTLTAKITQTTSGNPEVFLLMTNELFSDINDNNISWVTVATLNTDNPNAIISGNGVITGVKTVGNATFSKLIFSYMNE